MAAAVPTPEPGDVWAFRFADKRDVFIHGRVTNARGVVFVVAEYQRTADLCVVPLDQFRDTYRLHQAAPVAVPL